jgi:NADH-quinone oxidoreductase subunit M
MLDLSPREVAIFVPLILIVLWMGIYPASFTAITGPTIEQMISNYQVAVGPTQPGSIIAPAEAAPTEPAAEPAAPPPASATPSGGQ